MNPTPIDDEALLAYLDAQFDDEARYAEVEQALDVQPALRARLQALVDSGEQARRAFDATLEAPVPSALIAAILQAPLPTPVRAAASAVPESVHRPEAAAPGPGERLRGWLGLGRPGFGAATAFASLALVALGGLIGYQLHTPGPGAAPLASAGELLRQPALAVALETAPSGRRLRVGGDQIELVASFAGADGRVCREFSASHPAPIRQDEAGIACREPDGQWRVAFVQRAPQQAGAYQTAGDALHEAVDAYVSRHLPGGALSPEQEQALLLRGWSGGPAQ